MSSLGAKGGYKTEKVVIAEVNNASKEGMFWINQLGLGEFDYVCADACASGKKGDAALVISGGQGRTLVNVSIKSISSGVGGFNQVDRAWLRTYQKAFAWSEEMVDLLARGFGLQFLALDEPYVPTTTGFDSLSEDELGVLNKCFKDPINRKNLATYIFKGDERTVYRADYMLVYVGTPLLGWSGVWPIQNIIDLLCSPPVFECRKTVLNLGPITIQRKGGDSGKPTKFNLQFKFDPTQLQNTHPRPTFTREA